MRRIVLVTALVGLSMAGWAADEPHPGAGAFIEKVVAERGLEAEFVRQALAEARYQQSIIDAITRPAEAKPWHQYRALFLTEARIAGGAEFWRANRALVDQIASAYGIAPEILIAIVGIETNYGLNTGSFRVLDALATLGFYFPRRADFFARELAEFLQLSQEEQLPLTEVRGSYAGAMGIGQFMPSSYRAYAIDFDRSGRRDLWQSLPDALASVAHYLAAHGWQTGAPVGLAVARMPADSDHEAALALNHQLGDLQQSGVVFEADGLATDTPALLVKLEQVDGLEYWVGLNNFYVITRYNRSPLYAMAVWQLGQAIAARQP